MFYSSSYLFQFMHCFEGHHVTTLGEMTSKEGSSHQIQELDSINRLVQVRLIKLLPLILKQQAAF
jgi:hypothetical protein